MNKFISIIYVAFILILQSIIQYKVIKKQESQMESNVMRQPKTLLYTGLLLVIGLPVIAVVSYFFIEISIQAYVGSLIFEGFMVIAGVLLILSSNKWQVVVNDNSFELTTAFGKVTTYSFDEVECRVIKTRYEIFHNRKRILIVGPMVINGNVLKDKLM